MRLHSRRRAPLWFGPAPGNPPVNRFDDPKGKFRTCYLGASAEACFAETFLREPPVRVLDLADLGKRALATIEVRRDLRMVPLHGPALARLGATAEAGSGSAYAFSRRWSRALWSHRDEPDGIAHRARHDDSAFCFVLYDRARDYIAVTSERPLTEDLDLLAQLLKRYGLGLE